MKKLTFCKSLFLLFALIAGSTNSWALTVKKYKTEGFETKVAGDSYQNTVTINALTESDCGIGWEIYYGTVSTSSKISGNNSAALRLYKSDTSKRGYIKTTTPIEGLSAISFKAKASTANSSQIKVNILYSTDGSTWNFLKDKDDNDCEDVQFTSSAKSYSYYVPDGGKFFKIEISANSTWPSKDNTQLTIDDVTFVYTDDVAGGVFWEGLSASTATSDAYLSINSDLLDSDIWDSFTNAGSGKVLSRDADGHLLFGRSGNATSLVTKSIPIKGNATLTFKAQRYDSSYNGPLTVTVTGATATGDVTASGNAGSAVWLDKEVNITGAKGNVVITFAVANGDRIRVDDILLVLDETTATITNAEYATFVSPYATNFSTTGITAYTATDNRTYVKLNEITSGKVPAGTPVVLYKAGGGTVNVPVIASADGVGDNDLRVSEGTDVANMFVLAKKNDIVGFYKWAGSSDLSAGKVYLLGKTTGSARDFLGFDGETTTAIDNVVVKPIDDNAPMFNLAGQRVNKSYKGVVIVNGKKVVKK